MCLNRSISIPCHLAWYYCTYSAYISWLFIFDFNILFKCLCTLSCTKYTKLIIYFLFKHIYLISLCIWVFFHMIINSLCWIFFLLNSWIHIFIYLGVGFIIFHIFWPNAKYLSTTNYRFIWMNCYLIELLSWDVIHVRCVRG